MVGKLLKGLAKTAKRALTNDGGGVLTVTSETNEFDLHAAGAVVIRIVAAILVGLVIYFMEKHGLPGAEIVNDGLNALESAE